MLAKRRESPDPFLQKTICLNTPLHIVCLDAPSPPDYGGAIDMFYKIKALAQTGRRITLHYFDYHPRRNASGLENDCAAIHAYKRTSILQAPPLSRPFIVGSRINQELIRRLNEDDHPILVEGLHCSGILPYLNHPQRVVLRMHNDEAAYYHHLAQTESKLLKRAYFTQESRLLARYQRTLSKATKLACLSESDAKTFTAAYGFTDVEFIPCFVPWQRLSLAAGTGDYCLYHGNMRVSENEEAALWLMENVFSKLRVPLVIAGKSLSTKVQRKAALYRHVSLVNDPSIGEVEELIHKAQVNVLPSMNSTGVKLKLLNALFNGRHCITNAAGVKGSRINQGVLVANSATEWIQSVQACMQQTFTQTQMEERMEILRLYNNHSNAEKLNARWTHCQ